MAIIQCPECGRDISDQAKNCVHCGYPLPKGKTVKNGTEDRLSASSGGNYADSGNRRKKWILPVMIGVIAVAAVIAIVLLVTGKKPLQVSIGQAIALGHYPQTAEGTDQTPIEWIVLDYDEANRKALLLSLYGLDAVPYNTEYTDITWEKCTLRTWLNGEFLNKAFSATEQSAILMTKVDNSKSQGYSEWNTDGGNNTEDRIFLLSYAEANRYLGVAYDDSNNLKSRVAPTAYALAQGAWIDYSKTEDGAAAGWWWLRSPGYDQASAADVYTAGSLDFDGVDFGGRVVRPAFWLNLKSDIF